MTAADDDGERLRRVRLANIRQELLAPASALVRHGEMLHEGAVRDHLDDITPDLARILTAARELSDLLPPAYSWFSESFDTPDLKDAKSLLEELA